MASVDLPRADGTFRVAPGPPAVPARALAASLADRIGGGALPSLLPIVLLWSAALKFDGADWQWPDRDRFVAASATALAALRAIAPLTRDPAVPGHQPHPAEAVAVLSGAEAVGIALGLAEAERQMAARFGRSLVDHRVWLAMGADDLAEGLAQEAVELAGRRRLDRLSCLIDATGPHAEDARARLAAAGWAVKSAAATDTEALGAALCFAQRSRKPTAVWCLPSPFPAPSPAASPASMSLAAEVAQTWRGLGARGAPRRRAWLRRLALHAQRSEFERVLAGRLPEAFHAVASGFRRPPPGTQSPAEAGSALIEPLLAAMPELVGLHAQKLETGRWVCVPRRPQALAAMANGIALHGGLMPISVIDPSSLDQQLPMLVSAALLGLRSVLLVADGAEGGVGRAGGVVAASLAWLRAVPRLLVFRPACAHEAGACLEIAFRSQDRPSVVILPDPGVMVEPSGLVPAGSVLRSGGYVRAEDPGRDATLIASGPGVATALRVRALLAGEGIALAIVSLPCWSLFAEADPAYRDRVLGGAPRFGLEASSRAGWDVWLSQDGGVFGPHEPAFAEDGADPHRCAPARVARLIRRRLGR